VLLGALPSTHGSTHRLPRQTLGLPVGRDARRGPWFLQHRLPRSLRSVLSPRVRCAVCVWACLVARRLRVAWPSPGCTASASAGRSPFPLSLFCGFLFLLLRRPRVREGLGATGSRRRRRRGRRWAARTTTASSRRAPAEAHLFPRIAPCSLRPVGSCPVRRCPLPSSALVGCSAAAAAGFLYLLCFWVTLPVIASCCSWSDEDTFQTHGVA